jgi:hypothetical protein
LSCFSPYTGLLYYLFLDICPQRLSFGGLLGVVGMKTERENLNVMKGMREYSWFRPAFLAAKKTAEENKSRTVYEPVKDAEAWGT